ncbi:hypothetical protein E2C01_081087 [Portunus trituberculatus]|uniref:Uncharacterized protein n=1 Tax=Portunus trituberculatus TaxID=210409 RepID=A0A5B7J1A6_PORTR|nr:hypothetical protein [Portunus trituberculatus]
MKAGSHHTSSDPSKCMRSFSFSTPHKTDERSSDKSPKRLTMRTEAFVMQRFDDASLAFTESPEP